MACFVMIFQLGAILIIILGTHFLVYYYLSPFSCFQRANINFQVSSVKNRLPSHIDNFEDLQTNLKIWFPLGHLIKFAMI